MLYSLGISLYAMAVKAASLFHAKARLMVKGQSGTFRMLQEHLEADAEYLWFHAASLGEFEQGRMLMEKIRKQYPQYRLLLTFFSPSGYEVRKNYEGADIVCYLPFDTPGNARRFVEMVHPKMAFFIKYEFWKNYLCQLKRHHIPAYSVASIFRPNQIFFRSYGRHYAKVLDCFARFFVQNEQSYDLLVGKGYDNVTIVGDTRFDRVMEIRMQASEEPLAASFAAAPRKEKTRVMVAGSTWAPDEEILIDYFNTHEDLLLILAPHVVSESHLKDIENQLHRPSVRLSQADAATASQVDCLIVDCYGKLSSIYRYGEVAYVGGGFGVGIHNVPEAAVYGIPVLIGPNNAKFREVQNLKKCGAVFEIHDGAELGHVLDSFVTHPEEREKAGKAAEMYIQGELGAVDRILATFQGQL